MKLSTQGRYGMQEVAWPGVDVRRAPGAAGLITYRSAATTNRHAVVCRPWDLSATTEIPALFGTGRPAMLAKGAHRLKEPST